MPDSKKNNQKGKAKDNTSLKNSSRDNESLKSGNSLKSKSKDIGHSQGKQDSKSKDWNWKKYKETVGNKDKQKQEVILKTSSKELPTTKSKENGSLRTKSKDVANLRTKSDEAISLRSKSKQNLQTKSSGLKTKSIIGFPGRRSPSLESSKSVGGVPTLKKPLTSEDFAVLTPEGGLPPELSGEIAYDCCAFLVYCPKHDKVAISKGDKGNSYWLPFLPMKSGESWTTTAIAGVSFIISHGDLKNIASLEEGLPFLSPEVIHILRIQIPGIPKFVTRVTYAVRINKDVKFNCCRNDKRIDWIKFNDVAEGNIEKLWGPEPFLLAKQASAKVIDKRIVDEYSVDDALFFAPREPPRNNEEELVSSAGFTDSDILRMFTEFLSHCFPSQFMTSTSFTVFMTKMGWTTNENRLFSTFKAFNYRGGGYLTFHELLLGLAAMDQATRHGKAPGALRCGYIFRYYDSDSDGLLDYSDIERMTTDIFLGKQVEVDEHAIEKDTKNRMEQILKLKKHDKVHFVQLMESIGNMKFRGTSALFRAPSSILNKVAERSGLSSKEFSGDKHPSIAKKYYRGTCQSCKSRSIRIAEFSVAVDYTGRIIDPKSMVETEGTDINWASNDPQIEQLRTFSRETLFNQTAPEKTILNIIRQFDATQRKRLQNEVKDWNKLDRNDVLTGVETLSKKVSEIFTKEPRCVRVSSPVFVFGDTHGNLADLLIYERNLWKMGPNVLQNNFLFLGDFVDRGEFGVEVACYLFAMKILAPDTFFLIRGNHEIRSIQKCFTFMKECNLKYGTRVGPQVFEACNRAFDRMPICAVIDDTIFAAHGGIPTSLMKIDDLMKIPSPLQEPENECPAAWEMMWSDPMNANEFNDLAEFMKIRTEKTHGFISNTKRGTAFYFAEQAVDNFLHMNGLQYVLRAHEVVPLGYKFHMNGKVITVFSSSRYCGGTNEASAVFCDNEEIRIVRLETRATL